MTLPDLGELKPYPEMKDSGVEWLGEVPEHWEVLPGRACFREKKQPNLALQEKTVLSLSYGQIVVKPPEKLHGLVPSSFETYQIVNPLDIVIRPTDLQNDWNSLRFGLSRHRGIITSAYLCFRSINPVTPEYGHLLFHSYDLMKVFYGLGSGLRQNLDWSDFKHLPCSIPPLSEQTAIVRFLEHADRRIRRYIQAKQKLIALLEEQKQAIIHQAVTGQIDVRTGEPYPSYKNSGVEWLGDMPEHWEVLPLKRAFVSMEYGISDSGSDAGTIGLLTMGNIRGGEVRVPRYGGVTSVDPSLLLQDKDLLFNRTNSSELVAKVGLFRSKGRPVTFASYLVRMRTRPENSPEFLNLLLNDVGFVAIARREAIPSLHQSNLNPTRYGRLKIPLPPPSEQGTIVQGVTKDTLGVNAAIVRTNREIDHLHEYLTRLIADVVTGKLDVRKAADELPEEDGPGNAEESAEENKVEGDLAVKRTWETTIHQKTRE